MVNNCTNNDPALRLLRGVTRNMTLTIYGGDGETPVDLSDVELRVVVQREGTHDQYVPEVEVTGASHNKVTFVWPANRQVDGRYFIDLVGDFGETGVSRTNWHGKNGIELVEWSELTSQTEVANLEIESVELTGTMETAATADPGATLATVAYTGDYADLLNKPASRILTSSKSSVPGSTGPVSKSNLATALGITTNQVDGLFSGEYDTVVFGSIVGKVLCVNSTKCEITVAHKVYAMYGTSGQYYWDSLGNDLYYAEDARNKAQQVSLETRLTNLYPTVPAVYNFVRPAVQMQLAGGLKPNVLYRLGTLTGEATIAFATPEDNAIENEYKLTFDTSATAPDITWPNNITWTGNCLANGAPSLSASKHYEVSVEDGYGIIVEM